MGINKIQKSNDEKKFLEQIGFALGNIRRKCHYTQKDVAAKLNCSVSHINDIESGNANTTAYELVTMCDMYHISVTSIIGIKRPKVVELKLDKLPKDEQYLLSQLYQKLIYSHKTDM